MFYDAKWVAEQAATPMNEYQFDMKLLEMGNKHKITEVKKMELRKQFGKAKKDLAEAKKPNKVGN